MLIFEIVDLTCFAIIIYEFLSFLNSVAENHKDTPMDAVNVIANVKCLAIYVDKRVIDSIIAQIDGADIIQLYVTLLNLILGKTNF